VIQTHDIGATHVRVNWTGGWYYGTTAARGRPTIRAGPFVHQCLRLVLQLNPGAVKRWWWGCALKPLDQGAGSPQTEPFDVAIDGGQSGPGFVALFNVIKSDQQNFAAHLSADFCFPVNFCPSSMRAILPRAL